MDTITAILENAVARLADARAMLKSGCPSPAFVATHTAPETAMLALCDAASDLRVQIALENDDDYEYSASNTSYGYYNKERRAIHLLANGSVTPQVIYTATHELGHHADPGLPSLTIFDKFFVSEPLGRLAA